jgi:putative endonuclease
VAIDVVRRVTQHNGVQARGARYTRARRPVSLVWQEKAANRSAACKREFQVKQLSRREKLALIAASAPEISAKRKKPRSKRALPKKNSSV